MSKVETVIQSFNNGNNCSQAILSAYCESLGLDLLTAQGLACPFGSCMARTVKTCGAVTGALMLIGLKYGKSLPEDKGSKEQCYQMAQEFIARFTEIHSSVYCCDLINDFPVPEGQQSVKDHNLLDRLCPIFLRDACQLLEVLLEID